jgi:hypothetical protein
LALLKGEAGDVPLAQIVLEVLEGDLVLDSDPLIELCLDSQEGSA